MAEEYTGDVVPLAQEYTGEVVPLKKEPTAFSKSMDSNLKVEPSNAVERFATGFRDPIEGAAQLLSHAVPAPVEKAVNKVNNYLSDLGVPLAKMPENSGTGTGMDALVKEHEAEYQAGRAAAGKAGVDWTRIAGNVANPINYLPGMGGSGLVRGAVGGALSSAVQPVTEGDFSTEKEKQVALGAGLGGVMGKGFNALASVAKGSTGAARDLMDAGVSITPGQAAGGIARRAEEAGKSVPVLGSLIRGAEGRAIQDFNKATINQALSPIGASLPKDMTAGRDAIAAGQQALSDAYKKVLPNVTFGMDKSFAQELTAIRQTANEMPEAQANQFENILQNRLGKRANPTGMLDGEAYQQVQSELSNLSRQYKSSSDAAQRDLGATLDAVASSMRDALERQNPKYADQLKNINKSYAMFTRIENAASRRAGSDGIFTPADLLQAVKSGDKTVRKRAFARGDAMLQGWAQGAHEVLGNKMPDSGTTERALWDIGGLGALGALHNPLATIAAGTAALSYTSPAMGILRQALSGGNQQSRNTLANVLQTGIGRAVPGVAAMGAAGLPNVLNSQ